VCQFGADQNMESTQALQHGRKFSYEFFTESGSRFESSRIYALLSSCHAHNSVLGVHLLSASAEKGQCGTNNIRIGTWRASHSQRYRRGKNLRILWLLRNRLAICFERDRTGNNRVLETNVALIAGPELVAQESKSGGISLRHNPSSYWLSDKALPSDRDCKHGRIGSFLQHRWQAHRNQDSLHESTAVRRSCAGAGLTQVVAVA
jgi:hypothetical protein